VGFFVSTIYHTHKYNRYLEIIKMLLEHVKNINFVDEELEAEYTEVLESFNTIVAQLNEDFGMSAGGEERMPPPGMADDSVRRQEAPASDEVSNANFK